MEIHGCCKGRLLVFEQENVLSSPECKEFLHKVSGSNQELLKWIPACGKSIVHLEWTEEAIEDVINALEGHNFGLKVEENLTDYSTPKIVHEREKGSFGSCNHISSTI
jgi:hypothetical protein